MAGVAPGDPANVELTPDGYLHLQITDRDGKWTAGEVFTTDDMRFGTYQWIVEGDVYNMDQTTVLGLFTYGPVHHSGADAENEIDIEFSQWNKTCPHPCNADFTVYPSTGNHKPERRFRLGRQLPGQWWKPHHGKNGMEIRPNRVHADEWRSSHRLCRRCHQDRNLLFEHDQYSANRRPSRHQPLVLQSDAFKESVRSHSRF